VLTVALVATVGASARPQATSFEVRTSMSAAQEVPAPAGDASGASGTFSGTVMRQGTAPVIDWELSFTGLTGAATAAHIHSGAPGKPGPVVAFLCGPCQSPLSGTALLPPAALKAIESGNAYVNVHTPTNTNGEIRGQLVTTASVSTALGSRQEVPKPTGNVRRAKGTFTGTVTKSGATGTVTWRLSYSGLTGRAVAAHIHIGRPGKAGPVAAALCGPCANNARGTAKLSAAALKAMGAGTAYVNIHTPKNAGGEVRGQIRAVPLSLSG
jgi:hypothetical protein